MSKNKVKEDIKSLVEQTEKTESIESLEKTNKEYAKLVFKLNALRERTDPEVFRSSVEEVLAGKDLQELGLSVDEVLSWVTLSKEKVDSRTNFKEIKKFEIWVSAAGQPFLENKELFEDMGGFYKYPGKNLYIKNDDGRWTLCSNKGETTLEFSKRLNVNKYSLKTTFKVGSKEIDVGINKYLRHWEPVISDNGDTVFITREGGVFDEEMIVEMRTLTEQEVEKILNGTEEIVAELENLNLNKEFASYAALMNKLTHHLFVQSRIEGQELLARELYNELLQVYWRKEVMDYVINSPSSENLGYNNIYDSYLFEQKFAIKHGYVVNNYNVDEFSADEDMFSPVESQHEETLGEIASLKEIYEGFPLDELKVKRVNFNAPSWRVGGQALQDRTVLVNIGHNNSNPSTIVSNEYSHIAFKEFFSNVSVISFDDFESDVEVKNLDEVGEFLSDAASIGADKEDARRVIKFIGSSASFPENYRLSIEFMERTLEASSIDPQNLNSEDLDSIRKAYMDMAKKIVAHLKSKK